VEITFKLDVVIAHCLFLPGISPINLSFFIEKEECLQYEENRALYLKQNENLYYDLYFLAVLTM